MIAFVFNFFNPGVLIVKKKWLAGLLILIGSCVFMFMAGMHPEPPPALPESWQQIESDKNKDNFVFVIDHSLSLKENQMQQVIRGYQRMIGEMPSGASAAIVIFNNNVEVIQTMIHDHNRLIGRLNGIRPEGLSMFHDALAMGIQLLRNCAGRKTIVFFTDGKEDSSTYTLDQIQKMAIVEGVRVYGAGIGEFDKDRLKEFSSATGGIFGTTPSYDNLSKVYPFIMGSYKNLLLKRSSASGDLIVNSFPDGRQVSVNGVQSGITPLRIADLDAGSYTVSILFESNNKKMYSASVEAGKRTLVEFRATPEGRNLVLATKPGKAAAFIDGAYVGFTGAFSKAFMQKNWKSALTINTGKRIVRNIPFGKHALVFPGKPELNSGIGLNMETRVHFDLTRTADEAILVTMLFNKTVLKTNLKGVTTVPVQ